MNLRISFALAVAFVVVSPSTALAAELGDAAPALQIKEWIKGPPVDLALAKGNQIVVVEFWATWSAPCRPSIAHLTELQSKFKEKGVVFIGISEEQPEVLKTYVQRMGAKIGYSIAADDGRGTGTNYMSAFGVPDLPHAFLVDKAGQIVWHGHPMAELELAVQEVLDGKFDVDKAKKRAQAQALAREFYQLAGQAKEEPRMEELSKRLLSLDVELGGIWPGSTFDPVRLRKQARSNVLMSQYRAALTQGETNKVEDLARQWQAVAPDPAAFPELLRTVQLEGTFRRYQHEASRGGDHAAAAELGRQLATMSCTNAFLQNDIAWTLLTDPALEKRDLDLAVKFSKTAFDLTEGKNPTVVDTYARALFDTGKTEDAIRREKAAIELCTDQTMKAEFEANLKGFERRAGAK